MTVSTNSLVVRLKRFTVPGVAAAALLAGGAFLGHRVHAASGAAAPMDDASVSSLVSLDQAVEAVAARVTPAVVNVAVTAKGSPDDQADGDDEDSGPDQGRGQSQDPHQGQGQGMQGIPPGLQQFFFGPGRGRGMQQQQQQLEHGIGSGIIVSPEGYIVTNNHVVNGAVQVRVTLNDRRVFPAKVVGTDPLNDIAVIKINAQNLPSIAWGDSEKLHPGQTVLAFGNPFGNFPFTVTRGIVSALNRPNPYSNDARKPGDFIQTDAAINPGNSGGPLVNAHGELVGINTFIISASGSFAGAGFAIPSYIVKASADALIRDGAVHHGYLGISMNDVTPENAGFFHLPDARGAIVTQVTPDSPAGKGGLKSGDVMRSINGKTINNGSTLQVAVSQIKPGTDITLSVLRDGKDESLHVQVGEFHAKTEMASTSEGSGPKQGKLGLSVSDLSSDVRQQINAPDSIHGAVIESVRPASPAEDAGIAPGDVILEVNRHAVASAENFVSAVHEAPGDKDILLLVWSRGGTTYRVVHPADANNKGF